MKIKLMQLQKRNEDQISLENFLKSKFKDDIYISNKCNYECDASFVVNPYSSSYPFLISIDDDLIYKIVAVGYVSVDGDSFDFTSNIPIEEIIANDFVIKYNCNGNKKCEEVDQEFYDELTKYIDEYNLLNKE